MGTPDFAVDSLDSIYKSNHDYVVLSKKKIKKQTLQ